jgi:hypothetical protein
MQNQLRGTVNVPLAASREDPVHHQPQIRTAASDRSKTPGECAQKLGLEIFPNDLTRMLYLASLRDCNSGRYLHPQLSARMGVEVADQALFECHDDIFRRLVAAPVSEYVHQLDEYIRYTRTEKIVVLKTWHSLKAYRATVPLQALPLYCELFCLNVETALTILCPRSVKT